MKTKNKKILKVAREKQYITYFWECWWTGNDLKPQGQKEMVRFFQVLKEISCQVKILYHENTFMKEGELKILYKGK